MKIIPVMLHYDYGQKKRGETLEYQGGGWYASLKELTEDVFPFWWDDYLSDKENLQKEIKVFADKIKPDIMLFCLMRDEFAFEALDYLKSKYVTINWFWDDQWRFDSFTKFYAPHFTYCVTTDKFSLIKYRQIGYENAILVAPASFGFEKGINFDTIIYKYDVSFVGAFSTYRAWVIQQLKKSNINVACFGYGWEKGKVSYQEMSDIFKSTKINLNISNSISYDIRYIFASYKNFKEFRKSKKRVEQIKARNFEIPAFGGFQLTNYVFSLESYFEIGKEIAIYTNVDDLVLRIDYYLKNEEERKRIAIGGYERVLKDGPTFSDRFKYIFSAIKK